MPLISTYQATTPSGFSWFGPGTRTLLAYRAYRYDRYLPTFPKWPAA